MKLVVFSVVVAVIGLATFPALAQSGADRAPPAPVLGFAPVLANRLRHFWGWGLHPFGAILSVLVAIFFVAVLLRILEIRRYGRMRCRDDDDGRTALDILEERFARGEIDKNEFERTRRLLMR